MKIALIAHLKHPISEPYQGGLEMHTHILTRELMERGHDVTLFALADSDNSFRVIEPPLDAIRMGEGIDLFEDQIRQEQQFINKLHAYQWVMQKIGAGDYDLVHNNCLHFYPLANAHVLDCPMVTVLHTPPFPSLQSGALLARSYLGNRFVSISDSLGEAWSAYVNHYELVYNGIDVDRWTYCGEAEPRTAVWCGRFCEEKGPEYAIEAARLAGYRLKLAGPVYDQAYFDERIAPRLGDGIEYVGLLNHDELSELINCAAVGLFTSTWDEPFGLVLPEILACGTPIAAFDSGAAAEILDESCGVIVPKYDFVALAAAMDQAAALSRPACRLRAVEHFPIGRMIDGYEALYEKLLRTREPGLANAYTDVA